MQLKLFGGVKNFTKNLELLFWAAFFHSYRQKQVKKVGQEIPRIFLVSHEEFHFFPRSSRGIKNREKCDA